jgi:hypothetical protein
VVPGAKIPPRNPALERAHANFARVKAQEPGAEVPLPPYPAASAATNSVRIENPIRAYHGSPHDFDRFDMSKVGTGEGAQAFGHGLYFAEKEGVARSYRDALAEPKVGGALWDDLDWRHWASSELHSNKGDRQAAIQALRTDAEKIKVSDPGLAQTMRVAAINLEKGLEIPPFSETGKMYEVALHATPDQFLDWDKPLSGQSPQVRATLDKLGVEQAPHLKESYLSVVHSLAPKMGVGEVPFEQVRSRISDALAKEGVPGIRYLDQGSRGAGQGTHNYVVWNPDLIEILRKYGLAGAAALPPALNALSQESDAQ